VPELTVGRNFDQNFRLGYELGNGASCVVHEAECTTSELRGHKGQIYAVKAFTHKHLIDDTQMVKREVRHLYHLHRAWRHENMSHHLESLNLHPSIQQWHPHIIGIEGVYESDYDVHIVMELAGRELFDRCVRLYTCTG
jgi:hypothetical protein